MVSKLNRAQGKKMRRGAPPGRSIFLLVLAASVICLVLAFVVLPRPDLAQSFCGVFTRKVASATDSPPPATSAVAQADPPFVLKESMQSLGADISQAAANPNLHAGVFVVEPETGKYLDMDARRAYSAASMIKLPVLVAMLEQVDGKKLNLKQVLCIRQDLKGGGSGCLQWRPTGSRISLDDCARLMMTISDNTATNMIIDLLGGQQACNAEFARLGLKQTRINNWLPDLSGTNTTSPYDLAFLLAKVDSGGVLSDSSRSWLFNTMEHSRIRTLLPMGIPHNAKIADKTGDIGTLVGDAGIVTAANGKRYIVAVAVERPWNDREANALIRTISKKVYAELTADAQGVQEVEAAQKADAARPPVRRHAHSHRRMKNAGLARHSVQ